MARAPHEAAWPMARCGSALGRDHRHVHAGPLARPCGRLTYGGATLRGGGRGDDQRPCWWSRLV
eukprot:2348600-Prymnesium_polylepis.1